MCTTVVQPQTSVPAAGGEIYCSATLSGCRTATKCRRQLCVRPLAALSSMILDTMSATSNLECVNFKFRGSFKFFFNLIGSTVKVFGEGGGGGGMVYYITGNQVRTTISLAYHLQKFICHLVNLLSVASCTCCCSPRISG